MNIEYLNKIKLEARNEYIPIVLDDTLEYILNLFDKKIDSILEIGTCIGYSSACFTQLLTENGKIDTMEIEDIRVQQANENLSILGVKDKINIIQGDAIDMLPTLINANKKYDFIFIDAAKGKYLEFFNYSLQLLKDSGIIIADNVLYKGMVMNGYNGHKHRTAVTKLRNYIDYITHLKGYKSEIIDIGDGISVTKRM
ncbi:MAG: O-methyltransferase [Clostridia bacterium]|nr:O-methyltransferase [Clostridia bacterium]